MEPTPAKLTTPNWVLVKGLGFRVISVTIIGIYSNKYGVKPS